ncbi:Protein of unknown function [Cotesia congregata]|uniref:Uncharacterized protein n=1 Tax=Cotesia congregata TaxID=51543 RepID=A0A8J2MJ85_COTCN|nr:Protein of unknown function [Cotesia congregata]
MKSTFFKWMDFSGIVSRPLWEYPQFNLLKMSIMTYKRFLTFPGRNTIIGIKINELAITIP